MAEALAEATVAMSQAGARAPRRVRIVSDVPGDGRGAMPAAGPPTTNPSNGGISHAWVNWMWGGLRDGIRSWLGIRQDFRYTAPFFYKL